MKLDYSCARAILLALEDSLSYREDGAGVILTPHVVLSSICQHELLAPYNKNDIIYCSQKLLEAGFIKARIIESSMGVLDIFFQSITYQGHEYLDSVRHPQMWEDIKQQFRERPIEMTFDLVQKLSKNLASRHLGIELE